MKKIKIILGILIALVIIAGSIMTVTLGLNYGMEYSKTTEYKINFDKVVSTTEIQELMKTIFIDKKIQVNHIDYFKDSTIIAVLDPTAEEETKLIEEVNAKYGLELKAETLNKSKNGEINIIDIMMPYILPVLLALVLSTIYLAFAYNKILRYAILMPILSVIIVQLTYFSILAILRLPITIYTMPIALVLMFVTIIIVTIILQRKKSKIQV